MKKSHFYAVGFALSLCAATPSVAQSVWSVSVKEADTGGVGFNAVNGGLGGTNASTATFTYTGALDFSNNSAQNSTSLGDLNTTFFGTHVAGISGYSGTGPATAPDYGNGLTYATLAGFLGSSGSVNGYGWGSLYTFTSTVGNYGNLTLGILHDDGASVYANGVLVTGTTAGPTSQVAETVVLPTGTTQYSIVYARENGTPSILRVTGPVPEPASWAMMILGMGAVGFAMRRRQKFTTRVSYAA